MVAVRGEVSFVLEDVSQLSAKLLESFVRVSGLGDKLALTVVPGAIFVKAIPSGERVTSRVVPGSLQGSGCVDEVVPGLGAQREDILREQTPPNASLLRAQPPQ